jgi:transposase
MIVIGVDVHKHSLTAAAVDELGRTLAEHAGLVDAQVIGWARSLGEERLWAVEDCRHVTRGLEQTLIGAGEWLVRVPPRLNAPQRRRGPQSRQVGRVYRSSRPTPVWSASHMAPARLRPLGRLQPEKSSGSPT